MQADQDDEWERNMQEFERAHENEFERDARHNNSYDKLCEYRTHERRAHAHVTPTIAPFDNLYGPRKFLDRDRWRDMSRIASTAYSNARADRRKIPSAWQYRDCAATESYEAADRAEHNNPFMVRDGARSRS